MGSSQMLYILQTPDCVIRIGVITNWHSCSITKMFVLDSWIWKGGKYIMKRRRCKGSQSRIITIRMYEPSIQFAVCHKVTLSPDAQILQDELQTAFYARYANLLQWHRQLRSEAERRRKVGSPCITITGQKLIGRYRRRRQFVTRYSEVGIPRSMQNTYSHFSGI